MSVEPAAAPGPALGAEPALDLDAAYRDSQVGEILTKLDTELIGLAPVKARIREFAHLLLIEIVAAMRSKYPDHGNLTTLMFSDGVSSGPLLSALHSTGGPPRGAPASWREQLSASKETAVQRGAKTVPNPFVHIELNTSDVAKAKSFYGALFDWKLADTPMPPPMGTYTTIDVGEGTGGGMLKHPMPGAPSAWIPYVVVDNVSEAAQKAKSLGAEIVREKTEVPNMGWFSIIVDPTGATLGLWETKTG